MWGGWVVDATNADGYSVHLVSGTYWEEGSDLPEGVYTVTNDWDADLRITPSTYLEGNGDVGPLRVEGRTPNSSYVADANGNFWFIYKGTVTVAYDEEGNLTIQCDCENTAGNKVKVSIGANATTTGLNSVLSTDNAKTVKFIQNGKIIINKAGTSYSVDGKIMK